MPCSGTLAFMATCSRADSPGSFSNAGSFLGGPLKKHKHGMGDMQRGYYLENYPHSLNAGYMDLGWGCWAVTFEIWCSGLWGELYFGLEMCRLQF